MIFLKNFTTLPIVVLSMLLNKLTTIDFPLFVVVYFNFALRVLHKPINILHYIIFVKYFKYFFKSKYNILNIIQTLLNTFSILHFITQAQNTKRTSPFRGWSVEDGSLKTTKSVVNKCELLGGLKLTCTRDLTPPPRKSHSKIESVTLCITL